jgi:hypothetical protein
MRADIDVTSPPVGASAPVGAPWLTERARATRRSWLPGAPDWFELLLLAAFAAVSLWVIGLDVWQVVANGRVWTGTDGFYIVDQMQYLAWIQSAAAHHGLVSNLFVLHPTAADYFQPAITISGALAALGVAPWVSLLLWKPIAVVAAFYGVRTYAHRSLEGTWPRRVAVLLGLFFGSLTVIYGSWGVLGDLFPAFLSWGYTFGLLAVAVMLFGLVAYARARAEPEGPARLGLLAPGLLGAFASLLHPWQGELLILIVIGAEFVSWPLERQRPRLALPLITVIATGAPLLYYEVLGRADLSWKLARVASKHTFALSTIVLAILPLVILAALAYRDRPRTFIAVVSRVWPVCALVIYVLSGSDVSATPLHAFEGITVPLSILAIQGVQRVGFMRLPGSRVVAAVAVAAATIPATVSELSLAKTIVAPSPGNANFITHSEQQALRYLAKDKRPGGVLTRFYLGSLVPAYTGRRTFVGDCLWSQPDCTPRSQITEMVFDGTLPANVARWFVQRIGAPFVLTDCDTRPDMDEVLAPLAESVHHFGCASVYTLRTGSQPFRTA